MKKIFVYIALLCFLSCSNRSQSEDTYLIEKAKKKLTIKAGNGLSSAQINYDENQQVRSFEIINGAEKISITMNISPHSDHSYVIVSTDYREQTNVNLAGLTEPFIIRYLDFAGVRTAEKTLKNRDGEIIRTEQLRQE